jgi:hypothetical protein
MGIHAQDTKHAGAWRLSVLASALDHNEQCDHANGICKGGSGKIERAKLEAEAIALGVKRSTFYTWLADARKFGILNGAGEYLYIASQQRLANIFLCNDIDKSKAVVPIKLLFRAGWKDVVFAAYLKANHHRNIGYTKKLKPVYRGKVISAKTIENVTGIPARTQRRYKKYIQTKRNIVVTTIPGSWETAKTLNQCAKEHGKNRHYFVFNDARQKDPAGVKDYRRVIAHTAPARRTVQDKHAAIGAKGRRVQILKGLRLVSVCNYSNYPARPQQAMNSETMRIWYDNARNTKARKYPTEPTKEAFIERSRRGSVGVWDRVDG